MSRGLAIRHAARGLTVAIAHPGLLFLLAMPWGAVCCRKDRAGPPSSRSEPKNGAQAAAHRRAIQPAPSLPPCAQDLRRTLGAVLRSAPRRHSDAYVAPSPKARTLLKAAVLASLGPSPGEAAGPARSAGYRACQAGEVVLLQPRVGHALVALRRGAARPVLVSVPHPLHEARTALEGRLGFDRWRALALVVAGAHRCASSQPSGCPGRTGVCGGGLRGYARSDAGHAVDSHFQAAHEALLAREADLVLVSLHGMAEEGVSLSDGGRGPVTPASLLGRAARALAAALPGERVTACQEGAGAPHVERLCGRSNLQGRLANGASEPCGGGPLATRGRFLHVEQSEGVRRAPGRLVDALSRALE